MLNRGQWGIVVIVAVAVSMSAFAWWYRVSQSRQAMAFWGGETALLVRRAPVVELWRLRSKTEDSPSDEPAAQTPSESAERRPQPSEPTASSEIAFPDAPQLVVADKLDISDVRGLIHARHALVEDASFDWDRLRQAGLQDDEPRDWEFVLRFIDGSSEVSARIDLENGWLNIVGTPREVSVGPIVGGLSTFLRRQFSEHPSAEESNVEGSRVE